MHVYYFYQVLIYMSGNFSKLFDVNVILTQYWIKQLVILMAKILQHGEFLLYFDERYIF